MLVPAEVWTVAKAEQGNAVLVRPLGLDVAVPIFIAPLEAQSILIGLGSVKMPRPSPMTFSSPCWKAWSPPSTGWRSPP